MSSISLFIAGSPPFTPLSDEKPLRASHPTQEDAVSHLTGSRAGGSGAGIATAHSHWLGARKLRRRREHPPCFILPGLPHSRTELARKCHESRGFKGSHSSRLPSDSQQE